MTLNYSVPPQSLQELPLNARLNLPKLLARTLALKCHLRDRLAYAYRTQDWEELQALAGPASNSRMNRLRRLVDELWRYHMSLWMSTYKVRPTASLLPAFVRLSGPQPFGWEVLELRYGGLRARLETMHRRVMSFLDEQDASVTRIEELEVQTETAYPGSGCMMMLGRLSFSSVLRTTLTSTGQTTIACRGRPIVDRNARAMHAAVVCVFADWTRLDKRMASRRVTRAERTIAVCFPASRGRAGRRRQPR